MISASDVTIVKSMKNPPSESEVGDVRGVCNEGHQTREDQ